MADHEDYLPGEAPAAHGPSHEAGQSDEFSVAGLSGELLDAQLPKAHYISGVEHVADNLANFNTKIDDATLEDKTVLENTMDSKVATHAALPTVHQNAPALIATHKADASAHHVKYTDAEARTAIYGEKPCFLAHISAIQNNVTGDGTVYSLTGAIWTEIKDQGGNFLNGTFTAPDTGIYLLTCILSLTGFLAAHTRSYFPIVTSNRTYYPYLCNPTVMAGATVLIFSYSLHVDMDSGDTAYMQAAVQFGTKVIDVNVETFFGGSRVI